MLGCVGVALGFALTWFARWLQARGRTWTKEPAKTARKLGDNAGWGMPTLVPGSER